MAGERKLGEDLLERQALERREYLQELTRRLTEAHFNWELPEEFKTRFKYDGKGLLLRGVFNNFARAILTPEGKLIKIVEGLEIVINLEESLNLRTPERSYLEAVRNAGQATEEKLSELQRSKVSI